ncbi:MAG TPA: isoprenylcysteine carboxylmethyltransferase family protein [Gemmatimonadaceae bacterium]|nr:isoprenylcysteine carboxylmethyltransferase family protein [Gemmatimonadaceae bacterium]
MASAGEQERRMWIFLRHLVAIALLPCMVAIVLPIWIARDGGVGLAIGATAPQILAQILGGCVLTIGLVLAASSIRRFAGEGRGTLAPWDPPRALVVRGPYRFVRNPMISGMVFVLIGEPLLLLSPAHARWALAFIGLNVVYIPLLEEPQLRARFGASYVDYFRHVPRLIPRLRPWTPEARGSGP